MKELSNNQEYKKMQGILPDYALGKASIEDKEFFEANISKYPDIAEELQQARMVFGRIEEMNIREIVKRHSQNLSVKVNRKLDRRTHAQRRISFFGRIVLPTFGVAAVVFAIMFMVPTDNNNQDYNNQISNTQPIISKNSNSQNHQAIDLIENSEGLATEEQSNNQESSNALNFENDEETEEINDEFNDIFDEIAVNLSNESDYTELENNDLPDAFFKSNHNLININELDNIIAELTNDNTKL